MEGGGWRVKGGGWRVQGGGWMVEGEGWRVEGRGWKGIREVAFKEAVGKMEQALASC